MTILPYPNESLRRKTTAVAKVTPELIDIAKEMFDIMKQNNGIGLASTQVGLDISLIVIEDDGKMLALFNPVILKKSPNQVYGSESCLSFVNIFRMIKRHTEITVKYRDVNNQMKYRVFHGLQARCVAHEVDHLMGKLFLDHEEKV